MLKPDRIKKLMWHYVPTDEDMAAVKYCHSKGIHISPLGIFNNPNSFKIEVYFWDDGMTKYKKNTDPSTYRIEDVVEKMYEYYRFYDNKKKENE